MPTFSISPQVAAYRGNIATNPNNSAFGLTSPYGNWTGSFLYGGVIQYLDGSLNVLSRHPFAPTDSVAFTAIISFGGSPTATGSGTLPTNLLYLIPGQIFTTNNGGSATLNSYNAGTGAASMQFGSLLSGSQNVSFTFSGSQARRQADSSTGYVTFDQFPTVTPIASGTIEYVVLRDGAGTFGITFTAGDIGSGADVEINDRTLTTAQPWSLSGSIRVRLPMSYTYTL